MAFVQSFILWDFSVLQKLQPTFGFPFGFDNCVNTASKCGFLMPVLWKGNKVPNCQVEQGGSCCTKRLLFSIPAD